MDNYMHESRIDEQLIEEYNMMQKLYSRDNEQLMNDTRQLKVKLDSANDIIVDKDLQIENLQKEMEQLKM
jgi:hypothetical protein